VVTSGGPLGIGLHVGGVGLALVCGAPIREQGTMSLLDDFKDFALKSNFVDMATGIIIGGAAGTVVKSLVSDIIMPPIGMLLGGVDFSKLNIPLKDAVGKTPAVAINYGAFINSLISFLIIAFAIFMLIKVYNAAKEKLDKTEEEAAAATPEPSKSEVLLEEIRDALRDSRAS